MKLIPVHLHGKAAAYAKVDDADEPLALAYRWHLRPDGYASCHWRRPDGKKTMSRLPRVLLGLEVGDPRHVDHKNFDPLDCRRSNLRIATIAQVAQNRAPGGNKGSSSRFRGVTWNKRDGTWRAQVMINRRNHFVGDFLLEEHAGAAAAAFRAEHMPFSAEAAA